MNNKCGILVLDSNEKENSLANKSDFWVMEQSGVQGMGVRTVTVWTGKIKWKTTAKVEKENEEANSFSFL